jgi:hypothetical protein
MALQKKKYRCSGNRSRGGAKGVCVVTDSATNGKAKKDYSIGVRQYHGADRMDGVSEKLHKQIERKLKFG